MNTRSRNNYRGNNSRGRKPKAKQESNIDPQSLIKKSEQTEEANISSSTKFTDLDLHPDLQRNLKAKGYEFLTAIQDQTYDELRDGRDLLGIAKTGTGKTGAFLIPIIEQMLADQPFQTLILLPTRELAMQVQDEFITMTKGMGFKQVCLIGGTNINKDIDRLRKGTDLIIGTPGRILDLMNRRVLNLSRISTLVLDEFDRMLDMGFINDVKKITAAIDRRKQTMLFSATQDRKQDAFIANLLNNPLHVKVSSGEPTSDHIDQNIVKIEPGQDKFKVLLSMMHEDEYSKVLVFTETKHLASRLAIKLGKSGVQAEQIHGNKSQNQRVNALNRFRTGKVKVLVATDVAARGIDIDDISHVINYQLPRTMDSYIHRIGRTGRAGKLGKALTFVG